MKLTSEVFDDGDKIPKKYGYKFENINPPLKIHEVPENTKSLVLIMDDPDALSAVGKVWTHWLMWNLPKHMKDIPEDFKSLDIINGKNDFGEFSYGGPAPPDKEHMYFFKLYALDIKLETNNSLSKFQIEKLIESHIIDSCKLKGKFSPQ